MPTPAQDAAAACLSPAAEALYLSILERGEHEIAPTALDSDPAFQELFDAGLVALDDPHAHMGRFRRYTAIAPETAQRRWREHLIATASLHVDALDELSRAFGTVIAAHQDARTRAPRTPSIEVLTGLPEINRRMGELAAGAAHEALSIQPGVRPPVMLEQALERDLALLRRLSWRGLYETPSRDEPAVRKYVQIVTAAGAEYRLADRLPGRMLIFDAQTAVIPAPGPAPAACIVTHGPLVGYLRHAFDTIWASAAPFPVERPSPPPGDALDQEIMRLLAGGLDQSQLARRLNLKTRTCTSRIAELKRRHGVTTLFQLGAALARSEDG